MAVMKEIFLTAGSIEESRGFRALRHPLLFSNIRTSNWERGDV